MFKAYLRLFLFILLPILMLTWLGSYNPIQMINHHYQEKYYRDTFQGTFDLLETSMQQFPVSQWPKRFTQLKDNFGYDINFQKVAGSIDTTQLQEGEIILLEGEVNSLLKRIGQSPWTVTIFLGETERQNTERLAQGTAFLVEEYLINNDAITLKQAIDTLQLRYSMPLELVDLSETGLSVSQRSRLAKKQPVWLRDEEGNEHIFYALTVTDSVLHMQIPSSDYYNYLLIIIIIGLIILVSSIGLCAWLLPLGRDLRRMMNTVEAFGRGHLNTRLQISSSSLLAKTATAFNHMAASIERLIQSNQSLTNAVAHDLRTPLARLRFALEIYTSETCTAAEKKQYLNSIHGSIDALDYLINQTLLHARYSRVASAEQFQRCCFSKSLQDEIEHFEDLFPQLSLRLSIDTSLQEQQQLLDSKAMLRAVSNLLNNACQHANQRIDISYTQVESMYQIVVGDDGAGIDKDKQESIFEPFIQLDNSTRDSKQGHGLGLAIVKQIAYWHKGDVSISSSALGGACFCLRWPIDLNGTQGFDS
ncbi:MAG: ATP-binding protein [Oceanospirillaceae bacterium]|nr:ATP-binding protein [Oceanospirillaceae bacterium]